MDPYNRIMRAAKRGHGVRLTAEECHSLQFDDAIGTRATYLAALARGEEWAVKEGRGKL